jgi:hypothetical protein
VSAPTLSELGKVAIDYALSDGLHVFPLHTATADGCSCGKASCDRKGWGKHPRTANGLKDATTDPEQVRAWWAKWPAANPAVRTGADTGIVMIGPDGQQGIADLAELEQDLGPLPATRRAKSGSGGEHHYFRWPADGLPIKNRKNHLGTMIDVRGDGGYFVAPPSVNGFGSYEWIDGNAGFAELPSAWAEWCRTDERKEHATPPAGFSATASGGGSNRPSVIERARKYLAKMPEAIDGQRGHDRLFAAARVLVWGFLIPAEDAFDLLAGEYNPRCLPPWSEKDIRHKIADAGSKPSKMPRGWLLTDDQFAAAGRQHQQAHHRTTDAGPSVEPPSNSRDNRDAFDGCGEWQKPSPLPDMPVVSTFPIEAFPAQVADYWQASAESIGVPVDYIAVPGVPILGASAGRARSLQVKKGYFEFPASWTALVGPPGAAKSPALRAARGPISEAEKKWLAEHQKELLSFGVEEERHKQAHKCWKDAGCEGQPPDKPKAPTLRQLTLDDCTVEAAAKVLADNPKGLAIVKDEIDGWVLGMNKYNGGKGNDKQFWLSAWAGASTKVNRAGTHKEGPLFIHHPFVAVAGMMVPASLPHIRGGWRKGDAHDETGFPDRFLWSFPDPMPATGELWHEVPDDIVDGHSNVLTGLLAMNMVEETVGMETRQRPYAVLMADDAKERYTHFTQAIAAAKNALDPADHYRGVLAKLQGYACRLAITLWCIEHVCGLKYGSDKMDADTFGRAIDLVTYFESHARRCLGSGWGERKHRVAHRLIGWLARHPQKAAFTRSEAFIALKDKRDVTTGEMINDPLRVLVDFGYVRPLDPTGSGRPGPTPEAYAVNPIWVRGAENRP